MTAIPADEPLAANDPNPAYESALASALDLAKDLQVFDLSRALANPQRSDFMAALMAHELAGCHRLMMRFSAMADDYLSYTSPRQNEAQQSIGRDAIGFAAIAARLMDRYRLAALALAKLRPAKDEDGDDDRTIRYILHRCDCPTDDDDDDKGGSGGNGGGANDGGPAPSAGGGGPGPLAARGRLKNGNPSGDFLSAPRCGAHTRAGTACRQPAMTNGRCRLHGGKSTGARTAEGLHKVRSVNLRHGTRTAEVIGLRSAASAVSKRLAWMTRLSRDLAAGHGVVRSDSAAPLGRGGQSRDRRSTARVIAGSGSAISGMGSAGSAGRRPDWKARQPTAVKTMPMKPSSSGANHS